MWVIPFHNIDPIIIRITPSVSLNWYGLSYLLGVLFVMWQSEKMAQKRPGDFPKDIYKNAIFWGMIAIVVGGRLGDVVFYNLHYYWRNPLEIFATWKGGMSFHGGLLGSIIVAFLYTRRHNVNVVQFLDVMGVNVPVALMFGRLANFINGELYGRVTDVAWAMPFPKGGYLPRHPSQLYEAFLEGILLYLVLKFLYPRLYKKTGAMVACFLMGYGIARFVVEYYREGDVLSWAPTLGITGGQALSLPMIVVGGILLCFTLLRSPPQKS